MDHANTPERLCPAAETLSQFPGSPATVRDEHHIDPASPQCKIAPSRESSLRLIPVGTGEKVTTMNPAIPTPERVDAAIQKFDHDNELAEQALKELFRQYPGNGDLRHVLLKIAAVNSLCQTCIFAMDAVARHIHAHHEEIDSFLAAGSIEAVDKIAKVTIKGKVYNFFSFATKYCSWQNPDAYPVYDSHVDHYLWTLQQHNRFASFLHPDLWNYSRFHKIMTDFRKFHGLNSYSFKQIDKFFFVEAAPPAPAIPEEQHHGVGAFDFYPTEELTS